jgi:hypothetical protein
MDPRHELWQFKESNTTKNKDTSHMGGMEKKCHSLEEVSR